MTGQEHNQVPRVDILSIPVNRIGQALAVFLMAVFLLATIAVSAVDTLLVSHNKNPETWQHTAEYVFDDGSSIVAWALVITWPLMEVIRVVLATIWENRIRRRALEQGREEGREEGLEKGRGEVQHLWLEWYQRRLQAEARSEPCNEPPPGTTEHSDA